MASGTLGSLSVDLLLETLQWAAGINKAEYQAQQFADAIEKKFNKMASNVGEALKGVATGLVAGFAVDRLVTFGNEVQKTADRLDELAQKTGSSVAFLAEMSVHADMGGVALEAMANGMAKFNKVANEAFANDKSQAAKVFKELGVSVADSAGKMRSAEAIYADVAKVMGTMTDSATKTALATFLAGKAGADMIPVWNSYANATAEAKEVSKNYGEQMAQLAPVANAFNDSMTLLQKTSQTFAAMIGKEFIPYLTTLVKAFTDTKTGATGFGEAMTFIVNAVKGVIIVVDVLITTFAVMLKGIIAAATAMAEFLSGNYRAATRTTFDFIKEFDEIGTNLGKRIDTLIQGAGSLTSEVKKTTDATNGMAAAVAKVPPFKLQVDTLKKINVSLDAMTEKIKLGDKAWREFDEAFKADQKFHSFALAVEEQTRTLGMSRQEMERYTAQQNLLNEAASQGIENTKKYYDEVARLNQAFADKAAAENYLSFLSTIETEWHKAFDAMFDDTKGGWAGMLDSLKKSFKKILLDYIYQAFAKPFVMQLAGGSGGQMSGTNSIIDQFLGGGGGDAGGIGQAVGYMRDMFSGTSGNATALSHEMAEMGAMFGENAASSAGTWTQNAYGSLGTMGAGIAGGLIGGWGAGALGAGDKGVAAGQNYGATLATIGMQIYGPIGAAIGAVLGIVIGKATDPDPDAMRKAKFGPSAGAEGLTEWAGKSAFGAFGFSEGEWLSSEQMGESMNAFIKSIEQMDNAFASFMTNEQVERVKAKLAEISKTYELGMEHLDVTGLGEILKDRLSIITHEISQGLGEFVDAFTGPVDQLVGVIDSYLQATAGVDFDPDAILEALKPKGLMEGYQLGAAALADYVEGLTASADSMGGLVVGMQGFQQATLQMVAAIDQAAASIHAMFMTTADSIRESLMTEEERYKFLETRADEMFAALLTETDPAKIADLASKINADINAAWGLLDDSQRAALGDDFLTRLESLDTTVADKMQALRDVVIEDSETMMETIAAKLEELFARGNVTADTNTTAANTMLTAANTMAAGIPVYVAPEPAVSGG